MNKNLRLVVAITGASGAIYALRFIRFLMENKYKLDLIVSDYGKYTLMEEMGLNLKKESLPEYFKRKWDDDITADNVVIHNNNDLASTLASGNPDVGGMVVLPCTMKTLSAIAHGHSAKLIERAADCVLKERQKLVIVPRETPFNLIHIRNMETVTLAGGIILPAMPGFYQKPASFEALADFLASKILNQFGIQNNLYARWKADQGI